MKIEPRKRVWAILTLEKFSGRELLSGLLDFLADKHNWDLELDTHPEHITPARVAHLTKAGIHGIILTLPCASKTQAAIAATKIPLVCVNVQDELLATREAPTRFVWTDNAAIGNAAAKHLMASGDFATYLFVGEGVSGWSEARGRGYLAELQHAGISDRFAKTSISMVPPPKAEILALSKLLADLPKPAAVFAAYDEIALGVLRSARAIKLRVPQQLIIVGADNTENIVEPESLSSIQLDHTKLGYKAAAALNRLLKGHRATEEPIDISPVGVVCRKSTRFKADQHTLVREINAYLAHHALERTCSANTIARHFALSRSTVEHRYRAGTGKAIYQTILDLRLSAAITRRKRNPKEPLKTTAAACGFGSANHLSHRLQKSPPSASPGTVPAGASC